jgi:hypothetical protein
MIADNVIDVLPPFENVKRGNPSTYADIASLGIAFLPQSSTVRASEMIGLHVLGKLIEKEFPQSVKN